MPNKTLTKAILQRASGVSVYVRFNDDETGYLRVSKSEVAFWIKQGRSVEFSRNDTTGEIFIGE